MSNILFPTSNTDTISLTPHNILRLQNQKPVGRRDFAEKKLKYHGGFDRQLPFAFHPISSIVTATDHEPSLSDYHLNRRWQ